MPLNPTHIITGAWPSKLESAGLYWVSFRNSASRDVRSEVPGEKPLKALASIIYRWVIITNGELSRTYFSDSGLRLQRIREKVSRLKHKDIGILYHC